MVYDENFQFKIGVSVNAYRSKEEAKMCLTTKGAKKANMEKMAFRNSQILTLDDFSSLATEGYSFCNIFGYDSDRKYVRENTNPNVKVKYVYEYPEYRNGANKGAMKLQFKCDDFFRGSYSVFIDIDYTRYSTLQEYIDVLKMKPSFSYCTYSDKINGTRKFRLFYLFDRMLDEVEFTKASKSITDMVERSTGEKMIDDCGTRPSQYFNGTTNKDETYKSYLVYSYSDFVQDNWLDTVISELESESIKNDEEKPIDPVDDGIDLNLVSDMERLSYEEFMHFFSKRFKYFWRKDNGNWIDGKVQFVDDEYFSLYYNVDRIPDGMCRRKKLFQRMCLRRVMRPESTPNEILFNAYVDLNRYFDNSVDEITIDCLVRNVQSCFRFSIDEIKSKYFKTIETAKEKTAPKKGVIYNGKHSIKEGNQMLISQYFDDTLSVKENLEILHSNGVKVGRQSLYNYISEKQIKTKPTDSELMDMIDPSLSIRDNKSMLEENYGIKVSIGKLSRILKSSKTN